ncbi:hypothetical protein G6689_01725 [Polynucleobacter paneuropaeus]|nr:hypothetical protein G6689_01725 [Polynucleobacter paneuropaeus]
MKYHALTSNWPLKYLLLAIVTIKILGVFFAVHIFAKYTPLVDSNLYLQNGMSLDPVLRTRIINDIAFFLNNIGGLYFAHLIFSLFSIAGLLYYYLNGGRRWVILFFLLLPSSLVWTSIVGKEAIFFGASGLIIVIWTKYCVERLSKLEIAFLAACLLICAMLRPHYSIAFVWLYISTFILKRFKSVAPVILLTLFVFGLFVTYHYSWDALLLRGFFGIDPAARSSRFEMLGGGHTTISFLEFKKIALWGIVWGIIGPFPSELFSRSEFIPFFVEGVAIFLMPVAAIMLARAINLENIKQLYRLYFFSLGPAILILLLMHAPFGMLNPGSAIRWRVNFEQIFYLAPLLLIFRFMDVTAKENSSFSS